MDMNVNIYLPDDLGERVKKENLEVSRICQGALSREVESREAERAAKKKARFKRIEVKVGDADKVTYTKAFQGQWLVEDFECVDEEGIRRRKFGVALTKGGQIAVHSRDEESGSGWLGVYTSLAAAYQDEVPEELLAVAAAAIGVSRVIELDI